MTGLLYAYCHSETRRSTRHGRAPEPRRRGLMARARHLLRTTLASRAPDSRH